MSEKPDLLWSLWPNALQALLVLLWRLWRTQLDRANPYLRLALLAIVSCLFVVIIFVTASLPSVWRVPALLGALLLQLLVVWFEIAQFWRVGLVGASSSLNSGIGFVASLKLCTNSLEFLGVGASKLTDKTDEFEKAILLCHRSNRSVRFLLCDPQNEHLVKMAKRAGKPESEYKQKVEKSLAALRNLQQTRELNMEVRLYSELPAFRLMFVNDELCLASHYVFGEGDGTNQAQLVIRKARRPRRDVDSLYYGFREYFERMWSDARPADLKVRGENDEGQRTD